MNEGIRYAMYLFTFCFIATGAPLLLHENQDVFGYLFGGVLVFLGLGCLYVGLRDGKQDKEYQDSLKIDLQVVNVIYCHPKSL